MLDVDVFDGLNGGNNSLSLPGLIESALARLDHTEKGPMPGSGGESKAEVGSNSKSDLVSFALGMLGGMVRYEQGRQGTFRL